MRINYQPPTLQSVHERPKYQDLDLDSLEEVFQPEVSWQGVVNSFLRQGKAKPNTRGGNLIETERPYGDAVA